MAPRIASSFLTRSVTFGPWRDRTARRQRTVGVVQLVTRERRAEDADEVDVGVGAHPVPILRSDVVAHAGLKSPGLPGRQIGDFARAEDDVVSFPVVHIPEGGVGAGGEVHDRETEAVIVRL